MKKDLSIIIVSYNTKDLTLKCITKLQNALSKGSLQAEVVIVDNNSQDGSGEALKKIADNKNIKVICNTGNSGYGKANNQGLAISEGRYILYLNSDVLVPEEPFFDALIKEMDSHSTYGALTVKVQLPTGGIDPASHRGFPTVWRSFCYYAGLEKITARIPLLNTIFGGYHLTSLPLTTIHEIDAPTGAFFLARKDLLDTLKGFDEDFFMYGEDIDLAFRIKRLGYLVIYDPTYTVLHLKYQSGIKKKNNTAIQSKTRNYFYESMAIFYKKHYEKCYPRLISMIVYMAINRKKAGI
ncbi:MAG: glycosyltransferase family 2 protein [Candidatus Roizmanbacteria bacterium]|nr:glycosyltransferase family 2 protein [Candidatus Roizmanbacteria bacterium]